MQRPTDIRRVTVLGSSVSMLTRTWGEGPAFPRMLEQMLNERSDSLWLVENRSRIAGLVRDADDHLTELVANPPDTLILHYGHVEAVPRRQPRWVWLRTYLYRPGASARRRRLNEVGRKYSGVRRRVGYWVRWVPLAEFQHRMSELIVYLRRETGARILLLEAYPGNDRLESLAPGTRAGVERYNEILRELAAEHDLVYVSLSEATTSIDELSIDGTHFTAAGHRLVAEALARHLLAYS